MVSTATPLERSESRDHRASMPFFSTLLSGIIVKFHFKAVEIRNGKEMRWGCAMSKWRPARFIAKKRLVS